MIKVDKIETQKPLKVDVVTNAIIKKGFSPYVENGYWYEYDNNLKVFVNTGVKAEGKDGANGKDGINGYTPIKGIDYRDGIDGKDGINGKNGENGKDGVDGKDGKNGENGQDGYTPVKGTDYWTEADKTEIETYCKNYIDTNITNAIGGAY